MLSLTIWANIAIKFILNQEIPYKKKIDIIRKESKLENYLHFTHKNMLNDL